jgi:uncharacterized UBP type Zn finger protein
MSNQQDALETLLKFFLCSSVEPVQFLEKESAKRWNFYGKKITECSTCSSTTESFEMIDAYISLQIPLPAENRFGINGCTIKELFNEYCQPCVINDYKCSSCTKDGSCNINAIQKYQVTHFPRVLIFCTINGRFKLNDLGVYSRVHSMQIIPEEFLIFGSQSYKLSSIIYHTGESMLSGHYVTAVNIGKVGYPEWYVVNDDKVGEKKKFYPPDGVPIMPGWDLKQLDMTVEEYVTTGGWVGSCPTQNFWMCMLAYTEVVV